MCFGGPRCGIILHFPTQHSYCLISFFIQLHCIKALQYNIKSHWVPSTLILFPALLGGNWLLPVFLREPVIIYVLRWFCGEHCKCSAVWILPPHLSLNHPLFPPSLDRQNLSTWASPSAHELSRSWNNHTHGPYHWASCILHDVLVALIK